MTAKGSISNNDMILLGIEVYICNFSISTYLWYIYLILTCVCVGESMHECCCKDDENKQNN